MRKILNLSFLNNNIFILTCLCLSVLRIYIELMSSLNSDKDIFRILKEKKDKKIHKYGLYMSIGYLIFVGPGFILS